MTKTILSRSIRADKHAYRKKVLDRVCEEISYVAKSSINGTVPYEYTHKLVKDLKKEEPWLTRNIW